MGTQSVSLTWIRSIRELRQVRNVVICGLMIALAIVLGSVATIHIGPYIKVGISGVPNRVIDMMFGPAVGAIFGAVVDVLKWMVNPDGPFFPGFTVSAAMGGLIYGYAFYRHRITIPRVLIANLIVKIFVNVGLNSIWLNMLYNKAIIALLPSRIISNLVQLPVDTVLIFTVLTATRRMLAQNGWDNGDKV